MSAAVSAPITLQLQPIETIPYDWTKRLVVWIDLDGTISHAKAESGKSLSIERTYMAGRFVEPAGWMPLPAVEDTNTEEV